MIRADVDDYDAFKKWHEADDEDEDDSGDTPVNIDTEAQQNLPQSIGQRLRFGDHTFGAPEKAISIEQLAQFNPVGKVIPEGLTDLLNAMAIKTSQGEDVTVQPADNVSLNFLHVLLLFNAHGIPQIMEYRFLRVYYQSEETWRKAQNILHCSPSYRGKARRDHVIVNTVDGPMFAQLLFMFTYMVGNIQHPFIVIHPYDGAVEAQDIDKELGFYRLRLSEIDAEVFPAHTIIRGALVVPDYATPGGSDSFVIDTDPDMFCRLNSLRSARFQA